MPSTTDRHAGETSEASIPWSSSTLHVIVATSLMASMGASLVSPALPAIRDALAISETQAGLVLTVYSLPSIVLAPVAGALVDRFGRRLVLVPSLLVYGLAGGAIALTADFAALVALRFVQGSAASGLITLSLTLVGDRFDGARRNAVMGVNTAAMTTGVAVSPIVGGFLADVVWSLPFAVYALSVGVAAFAFVALEEPEGLTQRLDLSYLRGAAERVLTAEGLPLYAAVFAVFFVYFGAVNTSVPFLLERSFALRSLAIGLILSVPLVTSSVVAFWNGRLVRYATSRGLILLGFACYGAGLAGVWLATSPLHVAATLVVLGVGHGLVIPSMDTAISALAPDRYRGGVMSLRIGSKKVGQTAGPVLFASLGGLVGYPRLLLGTGLVTLAASVALLALRRGVRPSW